VKATDKLEDLKQRLNEVARQKLELTDMVAMAETALARVFSGETAVSDAAVEIERLSAELTRKRHMLEAANLAERDLLARVKARDHQRQREAAAQWRETEAAELRALAAAIEACAKPLDKVLATIAGATADPIRMGSAYHELGAAFRAAIDQVKRGQPASVAEALKARAGELRAKADHLEHPVKPKRPRWASEMPVEHALVAVRRFRFTMPNGDRRTAPEGALIGASDELADLAEQAGVAARVALPARLEVKPVTTVQLGSRLLRAGSVLELPLDEALGLLGDRDGEGALVTLASPDDRNAVAAARRQTRPGPEVDIGTVQPREADPITNIGRKAA
jgi:hypothetical protein